MGGDPVTRKVTVAILRCAHCGAGLSFGAPEGSDVVTLSREQIDKHRACGFAIGAVTAEARHPAAFRMTIEEPGDVRPEWDMPDIFNGGFL